MEDFSAENVANFQEDLAAGQYARPRFRQPLDLKKTMLGAGAVFEIEDDEQDWDLFEDIAEENYEEDTYALFQAFTPADVKMRVMESDGEATNHHFHATQQIALNLEEMEKQMENVNKKGTIKKLIVKPGNGMKVPEKCRIYFHYMMMADGTCEPFDTSLIRKYPYCADLRMEAALLPGLELAVRSMEIREASRFIVHSELAFGTAGCPPRIPPNAKILLIVETLQYIDSDKLNTPLYMSIEERNDLPFAQILEVSNKLRSDGNGEYKKENYQFAIRKWRKGVQILEDYPAADEAVCNERSEVLHTLYSNLAQAYLKLEKPAQACNACKIGLKLVDGVQSCKLLYRFALAKLKLKDCDAALALVEQGLRIDRKNSDLRKLEKEILAEDESQRKAHKKMWSGLFRSKSADNSGNTKNSNGNARKKSNSLPPTGSMAKLMEDDEAADDPKLLNKLQVLNINSDAGDFHVNLDEEVPVFAYCSEEFRDKNLKTCDAEVKRNVVDTLPSVFFDLSDLDDESVSTKSTAQKDCAEFEQELKEEKSKTEKAEFERKRQDLKEGKSSNDKGEVKQGELYVKKEKESAEKTPH